MKINKIIVLILVITMVTILIVGCSSSNNVQNESTSTNSSTTSEGKEIVLKFGHVLAPTHPYNLGAEKFKEVLEKSAPSPVKVEIFPSGQLGNERDLTEGLQLGTVQIAIVPGTIAMFEPKMGVLDLPYLLRDREHAYKVLDGEIGDELARDLPKNGLRLLAYWENGFRQITNSKRPIVTPEDLKRIKIRVPENAVYQDTFKAFGANVVSMAFGEVYTALQQKTIDAQENPLAIIATNKFYETQKYLSLSNHFYGPAQVLISEKTWSELTPEMQKAVQDAAIAARDYERQIMKENDEKYLKELKDAGMEINEVDVTAFRTIAEKVWKSYEDKYGDLIEKINKN